MAQLPPKIPSLASSDWPALHHHHHNQKMPNQWVDEFLDFSSTRRGSHRRSVSDSIAYLETASPSIDADCHQNVSAMMLMNNNVGHGFDGLDDEQLMSMFSDDVSVMVPLSLSASNSSTPSDQNSNNDEKYSNNVHHHDHQNQDHWLQQHPKREPGEVESLCQLDLLPPPCFSTNTTTTGSAASGDICKDPKRVKRILANRQSAQRSRVRKLQYISELERSVNSLQGEVSTLSPRVAFLDRQRLILNVDNSALKQRIAALAQDKIFKDAHQEALKKEIERLMQVYHQQNLKKMSNNTSSPSPPPQQQPQTSDDMDLAGREQILS